jgi:histidinol-phosphate aminotransferase
VLTQATAEFVLEHSAVLDTQAAALREERGRVAAALAAMDGIEVFPSAANFLLLRITRPGLDGSQAHARLLEQKVLVKNVGKMHALLHNCLRVTVSTPEENTLFLNALKTALAP